MKKLLLTSVGFVNPIIAKEFLKLFGKNPSEIKIIFIPTASRTPEELVYVKESKKELIGLGIKEENIFVFNLDKKLNYDDIKNYDSIYVCGGNTFYLAMKIKENGFDKIISKLVNNSKVYVGVSAGSILAGSNIKVALPFDENDVNLKDFKGLNLTDKIINPHHDEKEEKIIEKFEKNFGHKVLRIKMDKHF